MHASPVVFISSSPLFSADKIVFKDKKNSEKKLFDVAMT